MRRALALGVCGLVLTAAAVLWAVQGDQTRRVPAFLALFALTALAYVVALASSRGLSRRGLGAALALAALWRCALVCAPPLLSDDVYRYVWEGRIQRHGGNPYALADRPEAERWNALRDDVWRGVTFKPFTAIYPPLFQLAARAVVTIHDSVTAMKVFLVLSELALWAVLLALLVRRGLPRERVLIAAWNPLALVEIAGSGHNDVFGMLLAAAALLALDTGRPALSALGVALGAEAKLLPALFGVAWSRRYRLQHLLLAGAAALLIVSPYLDEPAGLVRSLAAYGRGWRFNPSLFVPLAALLGDRHAACAGAVLTLGLALALAWRRAEPARAALGVTAAWLLLAPNVLPWYTLWLLPWAVLVRAPAAVAATLSVALAYLVYPGFLAGGPWQVGWGVRAVEYGIPLACGLVLSCRWPRRPRPFAGRDVLAVLLKRPKPGEVKTRLIPCLGADTASALYRVLADATLRNTAPSGGYERVVVFAPADARPAIAEWLPGEILRPQPGGDLGVRLAAAFDELFRAGARRVALIGTDLPGLTRDDVARAFAALDGADAVLGEAADGGYYLVALAAPRPALFQDIPWSTAGVLGATRARAEAEGLRVRVLPVRRDIDTPEDLRAEWPRVSALLEGETDLRLTLERALGLPSSPS